MWRRMVQGWEGASHVATDGAGMGGSLSTIMRPVPVRPCPAHCNAFLDPGSIAAPSSLI